MTGIRARADRLRETPEFQFEFVNLDVTDAIASRMEQLCVSRAELARRMGVSRARVTQILAGNDNLTLKTLVLIASALDARVSVAFGPGAERGCPVSTPGMQTTGGREMKADSTGQQASST